ncbi:MAG: PEP-CTERM sorting domain-containing protein [Pirellulales bacterium]
MFRTVTIGAALLPEPRTIVGSLIGSTILAIRAGVAPTLIFRFRKRLNRAALAAAGTVALAAIFVLASSRDSVAVPVVINFESFPPGPFASHTESEVTFSAVGGGGAITTFGTPNLTLGLLDSNSPRKELRADIGPHATFVSVDLGDFDADADLLFLEVFNAADISLGFTSVLIDQEFTGMMTLSLAAADIAYAEFGAREPALNGNSVFADNFTFERVPEPGTLFLFLVGAAILAIKAGAARKPAFPFGKRLNHAALVATGTVALAAIFVLASSRGSVAAPVVINFESVPGGDLPSYSESGVTFDAVPATGTVTIDFSPGPNGTKGLLAEGADFLPIRADIAGGAISVSVDIGDFDGDQDDLFLRVYNSSDVLLDSDSITIAPDFTGMKTLSTVAPGIAYAIFGGIGLNSASNVYSDNFTFEVPEPGTLVLLLVGAAILAFGAGLRRKPVFLFTGVGLGLAPGSASFKIVESIESEIAAKHSQPVHTLSGQRRRIHLFCSMLYVALVAGLIAAPAYCDTIAVSFSSTPSQFISGLNRTRGWPFSTSTPIEVTALGLWDESADGFGTAHEVGIWNSLSVLVASAAIPAGTSAPLVGPDDFRFVTLEATVDLSPGIYRIGAAYVDGDVDEIAWQAGPVGAPGFVTYVGPRLSPGDGFADPTDISAATDGAFGPNFLFTPEPNSVVLAAFGLVGLTILASRAGIRRRE